MSSVTVTEPELLDFFGVEPTQLDAEIPWPYNEFSYSLELDQFKLQFRITPSSKDVAFSVSHGGSPLYTFKALQVEDVKYRKEGSGETLEIVVTSQDKLWLRVFPSLRITQDVSEF